MGGASGVGMGWEERMGAASRGCWHQAPRASPFLPMDCWWAADSQALAQREPLHACSSQATGCTVCSHPCLAPHCLAGPVGLEAPLGMLTANGL